MSDLVGCNWLSVGCAHGDTPAVGQWQEVEREKRRTHTSVPCQPDDN